VDIKIVKASSEDAIGIQNVFYTTWLDTYPNDEIGITVDDLKYRNKDLLSDETIGQRSRSIEKIGDNELFLVAKIGSDVIGLCYLDKDDLRNYLKAMYILPNYQNKGVGKILWSEAKSFLDPSKDTFVDVASYNKRAIKFYEKLGFSDTGKRLSEERFRMRNGAIIPEIEMKLIKK
jgi:ribosomal protein S18 acetylase RimI-like enzyme